MKMNFLLPSGKTVSFLYQWDTEVYGTFKIKGHVESNVECIYSIRGMREGIRRICVIHDDICIVRVPDKLIAKGVDIHVCVTYTVGGRKSFEECDIMVLPQVKPEGYVSNDTEEFISFDEAIERSMEYAEKSFEYAELSKDYEEKAAQHLQNASYVYFDVDENGHLIETITENVKGLDFALVDGRLKLDVS